MSNVLINLPAPGANGVGAWVDASGMGVMKTIIVSTPQAFVTIEGCNQSSPVTGFVIGQFQASGEATVLVACLWIRAVTSNYKSGSAPVVNVGGYTDTITAIQLTVPADGIGAATDISSLPAFKTVQATGPFNGVANVNISEDSGTSYAAAFSFQQQAGAQSAAFQADHMEVVRSGAVGTTLQLWVAGGNLPGGGGGGGGGGAPFLTVSRFRPAEGDSVNLVAGAVNVIDCQDLQFNCVLFLPLAADSPTGTPVEVAFVNLSSETDGLRGQFVNITQQAASGAGGTGLLQIACSGSDTLNGVLGGASASWVKLSDSARFITDGVLDWIETSASWYNAVNDGQTPAPGNNQLIYDKAVPSLIAVGSLAGNTSVIQAISAGYWGQQVLFVNDDPTHTIKLGTNFGGSLTGNAATLFGIAAGYTLAVGSSRLLQYAPDLLDTTLGRWYVIGDG